MTCNCAPNCCEEKSTKVDPKAREFDGKQFGILFTTNGCEEIIELPSGLMVGFWKLTKEAFLIDGDGGYELMLEDEEDIKNVIAALQYFLSGEG